MFLVDKRKLAAFVDELETLSIIRIEKACDEKKVHYILLNKDKRGRKESSLTNHSDIEAVFSDIKFCLAVFDYNIEETSPKVKIPESSTIPVEATRGGINANGLFNPNDGSIIVKAGSEIRLDDNLPANGGSIKKLRQEYKDKGLIKKIKGKYFLQKDVRFDKLSPAAEFVIGGSCNGKTEWKFNGKTLKESFDL